MERLSWMKDKDFERYNYEYEKVKDEHFFKTREECLENAYSLIDELVKNEEINIFARIDKDDIEIKQEEFDYGDCRLNEILSNELSMIKLDGNIIASNVSEDFIDGDFVNKLVEYINYHVYKEHENENPLYQWVYKNYLRRDFRRGIDLYETFNSFFDFESFYKEYEKDILHVLKQNQDNVFSVVSKEHNCETIDGLIKYLVWDCMYMVIEDIEKYY